MDTTQAVDKTNQSMCTLFHEEGKFDSKETTNMERLASPTLNRGS